MDESTTSLALGCLAWLTQAPHPLTTCLLAARRRTRRCWRVPAWRWASASQAAPTRGLRRCCDTTSSTSWPPSSARPSPARVRRRVGRVGVMQPVPRERYHRTLPPHPTPPPTPPGAAAPINKDQLEGCLGCCVAALGVVMAGSGHLPTFKLLRGERVGRVGACCASTARVLAAAGGSEGPPSLAPADATLTLLLCLLPARCLAQACASAWRPPRCPTPASPAWRRRPPAAWDTGRTAPSGK